MVPPDPLSSIPPFFLWGFFMILDDNSTSDTFQTFWPRKQQRCKKRRVMWACSCNLLSTCDLWLPSVMVIHIYKCSWSLKYKNWIFCPERLGYLSPCVNWATNTQLLQGFDNVKQGPKNPLCLGTWASLATQKTCRKQNLRKFNQLQDMASALTHQPK